MTAAEKIEWIDARIDEGRTIFFATYLRILTFTAKRAREFAASGDPIVKVDADGHLRVLEGYTKGRPRYVIADGCRITAR